MTGIGSSDLMVDTIHPVNRLHPLNQGLVAWWLPLPHHRGGNRLFDLLGRHHGTLVGAATTWGTGWAGFPSILLNGTSGCVAVTHHADLLLLNGTIAVACKRNRATSGEEGLVIKGSLEYEFDLQTSGATLRMNRDNSTELVKKTSMAGALDVRHLTCVRRDAAGFFNALYHDGREIAANSGSIGFAGSGTTDLSIGSDGTAGTSKPFGGDIYSVRIYNRPLSALEVSRLYQEWYMGYPNLLRRVGRRTFAGEAAPAGGNRRRRVLISGSR